MDIETKLKELFQTSDLFEILNIVNKSAVTDEPVDTLYLRMQFLKAFIRVHPDMTPKDCEESDLLPKPVRAIKCHVLKDIYDFLIDFESPQGVRRRLEYFQNGTLPALPSVHLDPNNKKAIPGVLKFEHAATELKEIYLVQLRRIQYEKEKSEAAGQK